MTSRWPKRCNTCSVESLALPKTTVKVFLGLNIVLFFLASVIVSAQEGTPGRMDLSKNPDWFPRFYRPYQSKALPLPSLRNSPFLSQLIRDGKLHLSLADLRSAVRENNLDIQTAGYADSFAETDLLRAKGGGAPRGGPGVQIPSSLFAGAIGAGLGDSGGTGGGGSSSAGGISGGARQVTVRPRGSLDPTLTLNFSRDRTTSPLNTIRVSGVPTVTTNTTSLQTRYVQAFISGTSISFAFDNQRQGSTQQFLRYNPAQVSTFTFQFAQQLLNGFGRAVNQRFLDVAKTGKSLAREYIRQQSSVALSRAEALYWDMVASRESIKLAEASLELARQLRQNNKNREEMGKMSRLDVITADSELALRERDLVVARANLQTRQVEMKGLLSKEMEAGLDAAEIQAIDPLPDPNASDIPVLADALASAMRERPEIHLGEGNILNQAIAVKYAGNLLKPTLTVFGVLGSAGLAGDQLISPANGGASSILPGGLWQAWNQVRKYSFPEYAVGFSFSVPLSNQSARADSARARMEQRDAETNLQRTRNQITLEVRRAVIALVQAKAQVEAARTAAALSAQTYAAEEERLLTGVSTAYDVIRRQRDLLAAQLAEIQARVTYAKALVELERSTGTLDK
jgi:outer membrane protein TolC